MQKVKICQLNSLIKTSLILDPYISHVNVFNTHNCNDKGKGFTSNFIWKKCQKFKLMRSSVNVRPHSNGPPGPAHTLFFLASGTFLPHCQRKGTRPSAHVSARSYSLLLTSLEISREVNLRRAQDPRVQLKGPKCPGVQGSN